MTNAKSDLNIQGEVISWLRRELSLPAQKPIEPSTRINFDLGVDGEDGADLMSAFAEHFGVDISEFQGRRYFGSEAAMNPIGLASSVGRLLLGKSASGLEPLHVSDFVQLAAKAKK